MSVSHLRNLISSHTLSCLVKISSPLRDLLLMPALDHGAEIANRELDGEIDGLEDHGEPQIPAGDDGDERAGTAAHGQSVGHLGVACRGVEVGAAQEGEGEYEREEDHAEADVGPESADQVEETEDAHELKLLLV